MQRDYTEKYHNNGLVIIERHATGEFEIWVELGFKRYFYRATYKTFEEAKKVVLEEGENHV